LLEPDIRTETIAVRDEVDRSVVTLRGDGLFAPATATLEPQQEELMRRIAQALAQIGGQVLVTGYTDTVPIRTLRFPSNWHLSEARARTVAQLLVQAGVPAERVRSEGRADGDPVASNETADGRRLNRRVEITLLARAEGFGRAGQAASQAGR
jgi:type VI secretion system protein ImpK